MQKGFLKGEKKGIVGRVQWALRSALNGVEVGCKSKTKNCVRHFTSNVSNVVGQRQQGARSGAKKINVYLTNQSKKIAVKSHVGVAKNAPLWSA